MTTADLAALLLSMALLAGYHAWLWVRLRRDPGSTWFAQAAAARKLWVESVMSGQRDILAVQTLRNLTTGASFFASTAVIVIMGLLGIVLTSERLPALIHNLNLLGSTAETLITVKILALVACLLFAFVNFTVSIRYYNHVAVDINVPEVDGGPVSARMVHRLLERGAVHYTLGMRGFYLALPLVLWLFGPIWMVVGSGLLCLGLHRLDSSVTWHPSP